MLSRRLVFAVVWACFAFCGSGEASAALLFCNHTKAPLEAAVGYNEDGVWISEGWWQIKPGLCVRTFSRPLSQRFYFYYARSLEASGSKRESVRWTGKYGFCVGDKAFRSEGDLNCEQRGLKTQGFHEIDIGPNIRDYTLNF